MHLIEDDLVLHYYGELTARRRSARGVAHRGVPRAATTPIGACSRC